MELFNVSINIGGRYDVTKSESFYIYAENQKQAEEIALSGNGNTPCRISYVSKIVKPMMLSGYSDGRDWSGFERLGQ